MNLSKRYALAALLAALPAFHACGSPGDTGLGATELERAAWLGSAAGWGLLGVPLGGGPVVYRSATSLEAPTWSPIELEELTGAWPGAGVVWVGYRDSQFGRYDYATGQLSMFSGPAAAVSAVTLGSDGGLVVASRTSRLELVGVAPAWRAELGGRPLRLERVRGRSVVALVEVEGGRALEVFKPPDEEPVARLDLEGLSGFALNPWGDRLHYLAETPDGPTVREVALPNLAEVGALELDEPGQALAVTPSGHRLYVAAGGRLRVFDRLRGKRIRDLELEEPASELRFSLNGAYLLARLGEKDELAVVQVGVDSFLGTLPAQWQSDLPVGLPGGRLFARLGGELVLYDLGELRELARLELDESRVWLAVEWEPPRPRPAIARGPRRPGAGPAAAPGSEAEVAPDSLSVAPPGYYAVVSAAREPAGVESLVNWLRVVGYPATVDRHRDVMGIVWFRAMAGPYSDRRQAEAAARSLTARYGYKPWILTVEAR